MMWFLTKNAGIDFLGGLSVSAVCILVVFIILVGLGLVVSLLQFFNPKKEENDENLALSQAPTSVEQPKYITIDDIKDEDMMVAALVATIDYHDETSADVRVVSVRQIG